MGEKLGFINEENIFFQPENIERDEINTHDYFNGNFGDKLTPEQEKYLEEWAEMEGRPSDEIRDKFFRVFDRTYKRLFSYFNPEIKKENRKLEPLVDKEGNRLAEVERFHIPHILLPEKREFLKNFGYHWFLIDFDDVINKTASFNKYLQDKICKKVNLSESDFDDIYNQAKVPNQEGKKIFRFDKLVELISQVRPGSEKEINRIFAKTDFGSFINQGIKRALQGITSSTRIRVSILTYGDRFYQKMRIDNTDLDEVVHEVIYTDRSKKDVLNSIMNQERSLIKKEFGEKEGITSPIFVTIDDSPEHIDDYEGVLASDNYLNIRFNHPQAKRYGQEAKTKHHIIFDETLPNQAALDIYMLKQLLIRGYNKNGHRSTIMEKISREKLFIDLRDPSKYQEMNTLIPHSDTDISWKMDLDGYYKYKSKYSEYPGSSLPLVEREYTAHYYHWGEREEGRVKKKYKILPNGLTDYASSTVDGRVDIDYFDFCEYIREAK